MRYPKKNIAELVWRRQLSRKARFHRSPFRGVVAIGNRVYLARRDGSLRREQ